MAARRGDIELAGLSKSYDGVHTVVQGINLKIRYGPYCCFPGPSGCGKTTILRMIAGHEDPTDGEIVIGGEHVVGLPPVARGTAMLFQAYARFPHLVVRRTQLADRLPPHHSGGQHERAAGARAAITEPRVLLLDEPLSALDEQLRVQMRQELRRMQRELGITFVHVTHTQLEAIALADIVVVMEKGKIKQAGPARDVYAYPRDRYVAEFLGGQNILSGRVQTVNGSRAVVAAAELRGIEVPLAGAPRIAVGD